VAVADDEKAQVTLRALQTAKGRVQFSSWRGRVVLRKWPKKRGKNISANQRAWVDKFSAVSRETKTPSVQDLENSIALAKGTGWYYRDVLAVAMNGKLWTDFGEVKIRTPTVNAKTTSQKTMTTNGFQTVTLDATVWNNNNFWLAAAPTVLTVRSAGLYLCFAQLMWPATLADNDRGIRIIDQANNVIGASNFAPENAVSLRYQCTGFWYFNAGDEVRVQSEGYNQPYGVNVESFVLLALTPEGIVN